MKKSKATPQPRQPTSAVPPPAAELAANRQFLQNMTDILPAMMAYIGADCRYRVANATFMHWLGVDPAEILGKHPRDVLGAAAWEKIRTYVEQALAGQSVVYEAELAYGGNVARWMHVKYMPDRDATGKVAGFAVLAMDITARKRAEEELARTVVHAKQRTGELEAVLASINDAVLVYDANLTVVRVNPGFISKYGFNPVGLHVRQIIEQTQCRQLDGTPVSLRLDQQPTPRASRGESVVNQQFRITRCDGQERVLETTARPLASGNSITGIVTVWHDITERKQAEVALCELDQRLNYHVNHSPLAVIEWGPDMRLTRWAGAAKRIFGWTAEEVLGKRMDDFRWIYKDDAAQVAAVSSDLVTGATPQGFSANRNYRKDGAVIHCEWYNSSLVDAAGKLRSILSLVLDVTARKQAEAAVRENEERLRRVVNEAQCLIWTSTVTGPPGWESAPGKFIWQIETLPNIPAQARFEYDTIGPAGQAGWIANRFPEDRAQVDAIFLAAARAGQDHYDSEFRWRSRTGETRWVHEDVTLQSSGPNSWQAVGVATDITDRKQAEEQIKAALAEKEVLLKEIHHRVKNNLQIIASLVSLQADGVTDDRVRAEFDEVRDRVRTMSLVHETLYKTGDLARVNFADYAGKLLRYLWDAHREPLGAVRLTVAVAPVIFPVDKVVTCGLLLNELATNALKHAFPNGRNGEVTVAMEHDPATGAVCLSVRDDGVGLPAGLDWRKTQSLGLRLVQMLAKQLHGTVETGAGHGTEFRVNFVLPPVAG